MQDRQNIEVDPTLVDRGWANMSQQLDEVMPVRKRRFFPWFFLLLFIAIGSSAGVYQTFYNSDNTKEAIENSNLPTNEVKQKNTIVAEVEEVINQPINEEEYNGQQSLSQETRLNSSAIVANEQQVVNTPVTTETNTINLPIEEVPVLNSADVDHKFVPNETESVVTPRDTRSIALLSNKNIDLLDLNSTSIEKEIEHKGRKTTRFYLLAEAESSTAGNPQALGIGGGIQSKIGKKLNLEIGLNYQKVSYNLVANVLGLNVQPGLFLDEQESVYGTSTYSVDQTYNQLKIERLNLPITLTYGLGNRWDIGVGIQMSFYTKAVVQLQVNPGAIVVTPDPNDIDADENNFNLYDQSLDVYRRDAISNTIGLPYSLEPNRWQWSALFSAQYQVSKHIGIEAKYKTNITNWPDNNKNYGSRGAIGLGIKYFIR